MSDKYYKNLSHCRSKAIKAMKAIASILRSEDVAQFAVTADRKYAPLMLGQLCVAQGLLSERQLWDANQRLNSTSDLFKANDDLVHQQIKAISGDDKTLRLLEAMAANGWSSSLPVNLYELNLVIGNGSYQVTLPAKHGPWAIFETLILELYRHSPVDQLDCIYDCGAFVGLSALYLHSLYPEAFIRCIEPSPANREFLRRNLRRNLRDYEVLPYALGSSASRTQLYCSAEPSMLNSTALRLEDNSLQPAQVVSLSALVQDRSYAIKLDIEGAEFTLSEDLDVLKQSSWIMGELHFGCFIETKDQWLLNFLDEHFPVYCRSSPKVDTYGDRLIVAQSFFSGSKLAANGFCNYPFIR
jgi:FkbM family methyltransferase